MVIQMPLAIISRVPTWQEVKGKAVADWKPDRLKQSFHLVFIILSDLDSFRSGRNCKSLAVLVTESSAVRQPGPRKSEGLD